MKVVCLKKRTIILFIRDNANGECSAYFTVHVHYTKRNKMTYLDNSTTNNCGDDTSTYSGKQDRKEGAKKLNSTADHLTRLTSSSQAGEDKAGCENLINLTVVSSTISSNDSSNAPPHHHHHYVSFTSATSPKNSRS